MGTPQDSAVTDPTDGTGGASIIALLKGLLAQLQGTAAQGVSRVAPVTAAPLMDASGSITAANTSQLVLTAGQVSTYLLFCNLSTTDTMYINLGSAATTGSGSIPIPPTGGFEWGSGLVPNAALYVIGPTAGDQFTCKWA